MDHRVDDKGKFFPMRVATLRLPITACIGEWIIEGTVHLKGNNRLKDELNDDESFIAITQVRVRDRRDAKPAYESEVLIVHKHQIVWIFPREAAVPGAASAAATPAKE